MEYVLFLAVARLSATENLSGAVAVDDASAVRSHFSAPSAFLLIARKHKSILANLFSIMTFLNSTEQFYMGAVALNNSGVSLLERNCYRQAMDVFNDAVAVMRVIASPQEPQVGVHRRSASCDIDLDAKLANATYQITHAVPACSKPGQFCTFTEEESAAVIGAALQQDGTALLNPEATIYLVRIEMRGRSIRDCDMSNVDLESSIILANFANSYKCLASVATSVETAMQYVAGAYRLFELSHSLIQSQRENEEYYVPMSIHITGNLIGFAAMLGMDAEAEHFYDELLDLQECLAEIDCIVSTSSQIAAAAA